MIMRKGMTQNRLNTINLTFYNLKININKIIKFKIQVQIYAKH
jgi:hypothetical protein